MNRLGRQRAGLAFLICFLLVSLLIHSKKLKAPRKRGRPGLLAESAAQGSASVDSALGGAKWGVVRPWVGPLDFNVLGNQDVSV